jgi:CRISPR-associated protein Cmr6
LGKDFADASPGMRFGILLPIWTNRQDQEAEVNKRAQAKSREGDEVKDLLKQGMDVAIRQLRQRQSRPLPGLWDKNDFAARNAWSNIRALTKADQDRMKGILARQSALSKAVPVDTLFHIDAIAIAPFTTGLGNEHPLENGFAFLNPYGLPYLPGSGVKGVLRQAARELASGDWGDTHGWNEPPHPKSLARRESDSNIPSPSGRDGGEGLSVIDALFGLESENGETDHLRGALSFWDVIPQIEGDSLMVEIMTPHQSHYYQQKPQAGSVTPHESGQPTPISFLTVPPCSGFTFHVQCDLARLNRIAPELSTDGRWKALLKAAFEHAFEWLGFGAKTAVGYGAMLSEPQRQAQVAEAEKRAAQAREADRKEQEKRQVLQAVQWQGARIKFNRSNGALTVEKDGKAAIALQPKGQELLDTLPEEVRRKVLANQFVKVTAYVSAGTLVRVESP